MDKEFQIPDCQFLIELTYGMSFFASDVPSVITEHFKCVRIARERPIQHETKIENGSEIALHFKYRCFENKHFLWQRNFVALAHQLFIMSEKVIFRWIQ